MAQLRNLFNSFGIDIGPQEVLAEDPDVPLAPDPLLELQELAAQQAEIGKLPHAFNPAELRGVYLALVLEVSRRRGVFTYVCARCNKPISDAKKLILDSSVGLIYGVDCYELVRQKQHNLQYHYLADGAKVFADSTTLTTYQCMTSAVTFRAVEENVQHCGTTHRLCAMCPGTSLKFKGLPCDFEKWLASRYNRE